MSSWLHAFWNAVCKLTTDVFDCVMLLTVFFATCLLIQVGKINSRGQKSDSFFIEVTAKKILMQKFNSSVKLKKRK